MTLNRLSGLRNRGSTTANTAIRTRRKISGANLARKPNRSTSRLRTAVSARVLICLPPPVAAAASCLDRALGQATLPPPSSPWHVQPRVGRGHAPTLAPAGRVHALVHRRRRGRDGCSAGGAAAAQRADRRGGG